MRSIVLLFLLIRPGNGADCASFFGGPTPQDAASTSGVVRLFLNQRTILSLAPSSLPLGPVSSEEFVSQREPSEVEPVAIAGALNNAPHVMTESEIGTAMRATLNQPRSQLRLEVVGHSREILPVGEAEFPLSGASKPSPMHPDTAVLWRGYWQTSDGRRIPVWARVRALCPRPIVRLRADVPGGTVLASSLLEQVSVLDSALRTDSPESLAQYEGKVLKHLAKAGSVLSLKQITDPPLVRRNMMVGLEVISGSLHLRLKARAEADGRAGESIRFVIPDGHRQFLATILPDGSAILNVAVERNSRTASAREGTTNEL